MDLSNRSLRSIFLIILCMMASQIAQADQHQKSTDDNSFTIKVGQIYFSSIDSSFLADSDGGALSTNIDFDRDLDMEDSKDSLLLEGIYRFNARHRMDFSYYEINRSGERQIGREITFGDETFAANSTVDSEFNFQTLIFTYSYLFHQHDEIDVGITAGLHINEAELKLETEIGNINESAKQTTPLPVVGVLFNYNLTPNWDINYQTRVFLLEYGDFKGNLTDTKLTFDYNVNQQLGLEFGINRRASELEVEDSDGLKKTDNVAMGWIANVFWQF